MGQKMNTQAIGLDVGLAAIKFLTGKENLHYGLWDGLDICAANLGPAQEAFTDKLFKMLPKGPLKILDIGGGAGLTARKLLDLGHEVDIIVPSAFLADRCRENAPTATLHEMMFEDFQTDTQFDVCLFSESFQYIPLEFSIPRVAELLAPKGRLIIADCFRTPAYYQPDRTSRVGGGHALEDFRTTMADSAFTELTMENITTSVSPSIQIEQDLYHVIGLGVDRTNEEMAIKKPFGRWLIRAFLRLALGKARRARLYERLTGNSRTAELFETYNHYLMASYAFKP